MGDSVNISTMLTKDFYAGVFEVTQWQWELINGVSEPDRGCGPENGSAIVGSYLSNAWGLFDMHGNVMEFCLDWYVSLLPGGVDPQGPEESGAADNPARRATRNGSWQQDASYSRLASRGSLPPTGRWPAYGFRIVRTPP